MPFEALKLPDGRPAQMFTGTVFRKDEGDLRDTNVTTPLRRRDERFIEIFSAGKFAGQRMIQSHHQGAESLTLKQCCPATNVVELT